MLWDSCAESGHLGASDRSGPLSLVRAREAVVGRTAVGTEPGASAVVEFVSEASRDEVASESKELLDQR